MRICLCLVGALAACGQVSVGKSIDAANPIDADLLDADQSGTAVITTQSHFAGGAGIGSAVGMIDVVSTLPNGAVEDMGQTDTSGHLSLKVYPGGSVTAIYRHTADAGADLVTFVGAKPSDTLTFGTFWGSNDTTQIGTGPMTLSWPTYTGAGLNGYVVYSPCNGYGFGAATTSYPSFYEYRYCDHEPMGVVGVAYTANGAALAMSFSEVTFNTGTSAGLSGWVNAQTATVATSGLPAQVAQVEPTFYVVANGGATSFGYGPGQVAPTGGATSSTFPWTTVGERTESVTYLVPNGPYSEIRVLDAVQSTPSVTITNPQLPPWVDNEFGLTAVADPTARVVRWLQDGPVSHDGNVVQMSWSHTNNGTSSNYSWTFITPPDVASVDFPTLPAIFADTQPHPEDSIYPYVDLVEFPSVTGYDALRALPEAQIVCPIARCAAASSRARSSAETDGVTARRSRSCPTRSR